MTTTTEATVGNEEKSSKVSIEMLAKLTGFPIELIQEEIFKGSSTEKISLEDLRTAMLSYIDSTVLMSDEI